MRFSSSASRASIARQKQILLECLLRKPTRSWLKHMDSHQTLRVSVLLYLGFIRQSRQRV